MIPAREILEMLEHSPDSQLSDSLAKSIREFLILSGGGGDEQRDQHFLHDIRDWAVYFGGASSFIMTLINMGLGEKRSFPPPPDYDFAKWKNKWGLSS